MIFPTPDHTTTARRYNYDPELVAALRLRRHGVGALDAMEAAPAALAARAGVDVIGERVRAGVGALRGFGPLELRVGRPYALGLELVRPSLGPARLP